MLLLIASYFFYAYWKWEYLVLILISTGVDFIASNQIQRLKQLWSRRIWLLLSISTNLGLLFLFKYLKLFLPPKELMHLSIKAAESPMLGELQYALYLVIPVGISFYTFQTMSYTLDVYWRKVKAEKHLGKFALFVCFFPQLVAGPIERFSRLRPQLNGTQLFNSENIKNGIRLILFGFFLKLCIADNLAQTVNPVYENPELFGSLQLLIGTFLFGLQIYGDFAGYSLIAQGSALLLGIKLIDNFKNPYLSTSISEFWSRWHISLSTWFRDYLYISLGGNRTKWYRWILNIMLVFAISGFWHGAEWTFLIWGGIHGLLYLIERLLKPFSMSGKVYKMASGVFTFISVSIAWVFFRASNMDNVQNIWNSMLSNKGEEQLYFSDYVIIPAIIFVLFEALLYNGRFDHWVSGKKAPIRWIVYAILLFCIAVLGGAVNHPFIYFQF
ncbi:MAG: MBOAT family protein [Bacteroidia bacterium]